MVLKSFEAERGLSKWSPAVHKKEADLKQARLDHRIIGGKKVFSYSFSVGF